MAYCRNCGSQIDDNDRFCSSCGSATDQKLHTAPSDKKKRPINTRSLVFSIANLFLFLPIGAASLILTALAADAASDDDEKKYLSIAKTINTIGIVIAVISIALPLFLFAFACIAAIFAAFSFI